MKPNQSVLSISLDPNIAQQTYADAHTRHMEYARAFREFVVIVLTSRKHTDTENTKTQKTQKTLMQTNYETMKPWNNGTYQFHFDNLHVYLTNVFWKPWALIKSIWLAYHLNREHHFDVITAQDPLATGLVGWVVAKWFHRPLVLQIHEAHYFEKSSGMLKIWVWWLLGQAQSIRVVNPVVSELIKRRLPYLRVDHIPMMIDLDYFYKPVIKKSKITNFISVGRLIPSKRMDLVIEAFSHAVKKYPHIKLTICGDGSNRGKLKLLSEKLGVQNKLKFAGMVNRDELKTLYHHHDVFILASEHEGWGNVYLEAAVAGLPIISTCVGAVNALFTDKLTAMVVDTGDREGLIERIGWIIEHPRRANKIALVAQRLAREKYDQVLLKRQWVRLLQEAKVNVP